jgi:uncharacterized protein (TIGR03382 family)
MFRSGFLASLAALLLMLPSLVRAGDLNCGEALVCLLTCPSNDSQCAFNCGQNLHSQAEEKYAELLVCLAPVCPGNPPNAVCILQAGAGKCESQYEACVGDAGCLASCEGKSCGDDGCGGSCGACPPGLNCNESFECSPCEQNCDGKQCGDDGCGGSCGTCGGSEACVDFQCVACTPDCDGKECGEDGCGGKCGTCGFTEQCVDGICVGCTPNCAGKECGDNGCGGMCGACPPDYKCDQGVCIEDIPCDPNCLNKECGDDGCGGNCGSCGMGQFCSPAGLCVQGEAPDIIAGEDVPQGDDNWLPEDDAGEVAPGTDTSTPNGNKCPPGEKYFFGQCVPDEDKQPSGGDSGGCTAGTRSSAGALMLLLALLSLALRRRRA